LCENLVEIEQESFEILMFKIFCILPLGGDFLLIKAVWAKKFLIFWKFFIHASS